MKPLARLVVRGTNTEDSKDGLILGTMFKSQSFFKKGYVYEVIEVLGEITIREIGPSWIKETCDYVRVHKTEDGQEYPVRNSICWLNSAGHVLSHGPHIFLSEEEYLSLCKTNE